MNKLKCNIQNNFAIFLFIAVALYILTLILGGLWVWLPFAIFMAVGVLLCISLQSLWDKLFSGICLICLCYIAFPKLLESEWFYNLVDRIFSGLKYSVYKSTFAENFGALLGSAIAIIGALWTEHHIAQEKEKKAAIENARVIYYDFKFAFDEVKEKLQQFFDTQRITVDSFNEAKFNELDPYLSFVSYRILIDGDWNRNVSRMSDYFTSSEIEDIYYVYGEINALNIALSHGGSVVNKALLNFYAIIPGEKTINVNKINPKLSDMEQKTIHIWTKLKGVANIKESNDTYQTQK